MIGGRLWFLNVDSGRFLGGNILKVECCIYFLKRSLSSPSLAAHVWSIAIICLLLLLLSLEQPTIKFHHFIIILENPRRSSRGLLCRWTDLFSSAHPIFATCLLKVIFSLSHIRDYWQFLVEEGFHVFLNHSLSYTGLLVYYHLTLGPISVLNDVFLLYLRAFALAI